MNQLESVTEKLLAELRGIMHPIRALVVEDNPFDRELMVKVLDKAGCTSDAVSTGEEAINLLEEGRHYHFVFLDLKLPNMSGVEVLKFIKKEYPQLHVVIISGASPDRISEVEKMGYFGFVGKPLTSEEATDIFKKHGSMIQKEKV